MGRRIKRDTVPSPRNFGVAGKTTTDKQIQHKMGDRTSPRGFKNTRMGAFSVD